MEKQKRNLLQLESQNAIQFEILAMECRKQNKTKTSIDRRFIT